jgi:hypothetical protein
MNFSDGLLIAIGEPIVLSVHPSEGLSARMLKNRNPPIFDIPGRVFQLRVSVE